MCFLSFNVLPPKPVAQKRICFLPAAFGARLSVPQMGTYVFALLFFKKMFFHSTEMPCLLFSKLNSDVVRYAYTLFFCGAFGLFQLVCFSFYLYVVGSLASVEAQLGESDD